MNECKKTEETQVILALHRFCNRDVYTRQTLRSLSLLDTVAIILACHFFGVNKATLNFLVKYCFHALGCSNGINYCYLKASPNFLCMSVSCLLYTSRCV